MTKETLLKFKDYFTKTGNQKQLDKVIRNLAKYERVEGTEKDIKKK